MGSPRPASTHSQGFSTALNLGRREIVSRFNWVKLQNDLLIPGARRQLVSHTDIGPGEDGMNWIQIRGLPEVRQVRSLSPVQDLCILWVNRCSRQLRATLRRHDHAHGEARSWRSWLADGPASGLVWRSAVGHWGRPPNRELERRILIIVVEQQFVGNQVALSDLQRALSGQSTALGRNRPNNGLVLD